MFTVVKNFVVKYRYWLLILLAILLFLAGFGTAKYVSPAKVVTKTVTNTVVQTKIEYQDRIVTQKVLVEVEKKHTHTETTTTQKPDGEKETKVVVDENVDENTQEDTSKNQDTTKNTQTTEKQVVVQVKTVTNQPNWAVHAGVGYSLPKLFGSPEIGIPGMKGVVVDAGIDRRILGPMWLGIQGNTMGTVGLNLRLDW